jgi:hypothetical protein
MLAREYFLSARLGFPGLLLAVALLFFRRGPGAQALLPVCYPR